MSYYSKGRKDNYYGWYSYWGWSWGWSRWWSDVKTWASQWTYVRPDYQKIKDELLQKQKKLNAMGYAIKIWYGTASVSRKSHWFTRVTAKDTTEFDTIRKFLDKTKALWIMELTWVDTYIMQSMLWQWKSWNDWVFNSSDWKILDSVTTYNSIKNAYKPSEWAKTKKLQDEWWTDWGWSAWFHTFPLDTKEIDKIADQIKNKLRIKQVTYIKEDSIRKWNRINRKYTIWLSHKPLIVKVANTYKKKRCLCIIDCSGSMSSFNHKWACHFMESLWVIWIFNTDIYYSNDFCLYKSNGAEWLSCNWGWEWFDIVDQRLSILNVDSNQYDYIFVFTDMNIWTAEMTNLQDILKGKKHILFNFNSSKWEHRRSIFWDLKIQDVTKVQDMIDNLINYV